MREYVSNVRATHQVVVMGDDHFLVRRELDVDLGGVGTGVGSLQQCFNGVFWSERTRPTVGDDRNRSMLTGAIGAANHGARSISR